MSRPMALGLILLVLFLTSQSDWKPPKESQEDGTAKGSKTDLHREEIKEKIIVDLTAHNKRLESENANLRKMVSEVRELLKDCDCLVPLNTTTALLEIDIRKAEQPSSYNVEKEEVELLGGRMSLDQLLKGPLNDPPFEKRLGLEKVKPGHALAGEVLPHGKSEVIEEGLTGEAEREVPMQVSRGSGAGQGKLWSRPLAGRAYVAPSNLPNGAHPDGPSGDG